MIATQAVQIRSESTFTDRQAYQAMLNVLEDVDSDRTVAAKTNWAILNILDDFDAEKALLTDTRRAVINMLDDLELSRAETEVLNFDLEERVRQRTRELVASEERFRLLVEGVKDYAIIVLDPDGYVATWNPGAERMKGFHSSEIIGKHFSCFYTQEDRDAKKPEREMEVAMQLGQTTDEGWRVRKDGSKFLADVVITALRDESGELRGFGKLTRDITERKATEKLAVEKQRAETSDRIKSSFLATMSHELRTPLNSIIGFTGIILQGLSGPIDPEVEKQLLMVSASARHLLAMINDVLDISKIEAGQLEVTPTPFDLSATVRKVTEVVRPLAVRKGLSITIAGEPGVPPAFGDERRVEQILLNLCSNSIKFTEKGGIDIDVRTEDNVTLPGRGPRRVAAVSVADTGIGIEQSDIETLFEPFKQIDSSLSRDHEGTGLGLAICRRLADLMGADITIDSTIGRGSTFTLLLPLGEV